MILIALACTILYKIEHKEQRTHEWLSTKDIIFICIGVVFDSMKYAFR